MKKLLALLLVLILSLGVLVACDTPEESSSSSSSEEQSFEESASSSIKGSTSFYYREYYAEVVNTAVKESIQFVTTYDEYLSIRNETALSYKFSRLSEAAFENSYVFYVVRMNLDVTRTTFMGYSDFEQIEEESFCLYFRGCIMCEHPLIKVSSGINRLFVPFLQMRR